MADKLFITQQFSFFSPDDYHTVTLIVLWIVKNEYRIINPLTIMIISREMSSIIRYNYYLQIPFILTSSFSPFTSVIE